MKVKLKIEHDKTWTPCGNRKQRYWINLSTGQYFPIFLGLTGWMNLYTPHINYLSPEAVIAATLRIVLAPPPDNDTYRKSRIKEQVFTFNDAKLSKLKLPGPGFHTK